MILHRKSASVMETLTNFQSFTNQFLGALVNLLAGLVAVEWAIAATRRGKRSHLNVCSPLALASETSVHIASFWAQGIPELSGGATASWWSLFGYIYHIDLNLYSNL